MVTINRTIIAASLLWIAPALGQSAQDHEAHHPDGGTVTQQQPAQPAALAIPVIPSNATTMAAPSRNRDLIPSPFSC